MTSTFSMIQPQRGPRYVCPFDKVISILWYLIKQLKVYPLPGTFRSKKLSFTFIISAIVTALLMMLCDPYHGLRPRPLFAFRSGNLKRGINDRIACWYTGWKSYLRNLTTVMLNSPSTCDK